MEKIKPFELMPSCPKCGSVWNTCHFYKGVAEFGETGSVGVAHMFEHLLVSCSRCSYSWQMHCKDAKEEGT